MLDRPGRIRYKKQYGNLSQSDIKEIVDDKLNYWKDLILPEQLIKDDLVETCNSLSIITIDAVISLIEEVNLHEELASALIEDFNLTKNVSSYKVTRQLILKNELGETYFSPIELIAIETRNVNQKQFGGNRHSSFYVDADYKGTIEEIINETKAIIELCLSYNEAIEDKFISKYLIELGIHESDPSSNKNSDDNDSEIFTVNSLYTLEPIQSRNYFSYIV